MSLSPQRRRASTPAIVIALLIVYVVWGSTYLGIALMIETLPPLLAAGVRYLSAGLLLTGLVYLWARVRRADPPERPTRRQWGSAFVIGTLLLLGGNGFVVLAEQFIPSGVAAVVIATVPIWLAVFDALLTRRRPSRLVIGGLAAGLIGVGVLLAPVGGLDRINPLGVGLVCIAAISWAAGSLYARKAEMPRSGLLGSGMEMFAGGLVLAIVGSLLGEIGQVDVASISLRSVAAVGYLIVFGSVIAFSAYVWLLKHVPVSTVGTYAYVNPIVAVALGAMVLGESITLRTGVAAVVIIAAVIAMVSGRPRPAGEPAAEVDASQREVEPRSVARAVD
ncbi:MAG: EamA family transporter [Chloroflexota bacterium]|nr:EamA family transporter [Chloroflexota bacterium]